MFRSAVGVDVSSELPLNTELGTHTLASATHLCKARVFGKMSVKNLSEAGKPAAPGTLSDS